MSLLSLSGSYTLTLSSIVRRSTNLGNLLEARGVGVIFGRVCMAFVERDGICGKTDWSGFNSSRK